METHVGHVSTEPDAANRVQVAGCVHEVGSEADDVAPERSAGVMLLLVVKRL